MKPPVCCICSLELELGEGALVAFADYEPLPHGRVGRPEGLEWFCPAHREAGQELRHWQSGAAVAKLRGVKLEEL